MIRCKNCKYWHAMILSMTFEEQIGSSCPNCECSDDDWFCGEVPITEDPCWKPKLGTSTPNDLRTSYNEFRYRIGVPNPHGTWTETDWIDWYNKI